MAASDNDAMDVDVACQPAAAVLAPPAPPAPDLIPGLPEDMALECLLRVSYKCHPQLQRVCRRWEELVNRPQFFQERRRAGTTTHCVCLIQAVPPTASASASSTSASTQPPPPPPPQQHQQEDKKQVPAATAATAPVYAVTVHDLRTGEWERLPPIPDYPHGMPLFCQCVAAGGALFVLGGWDPASWEPINRVYMYSFRDARWTRRADMLSVRSFFAAAAAPGGTSVYVAGGHDASKNALTSAEVYRVDRDAWEPLPHLTEQRDECAGHVLPDGRFLVLSGYATASQGRFGRSADVYDPAAGAWRRVEDMWTLEEGGEGGCCAPSASVVAGDGRLYAFHGQHMLRYQDATNSWLRVDGSAAGAGAAMVPENARTAPRAVAAQGGVFLTSTVDGRGRCHSYYRPGMPGGEWVALDTPDSFAGLTVSSTTVEV